MLSRFLINLGALAVVYGLAAYGGIKTAALAVVALLAFYWWWRDRRGQSIGD